MQTSCATAVCQASGPGTLLRQRRPTSLSGIPSAYSELAHQFSLLFHETILMLLLNRCASTLVGSLVPLAVGCGLRDKPQAQPISLATQAGLSLKTEHAEILPYQVFLVFQKR